MKRLNGGFGSFGDIVSDLSLFGADERFMVTVPVSTGGGINLGELVRAVKLGSFEDLAVLAVSVGVKIVNAMD